MGTVLRFRWAALAAALACGDSAAAPTLDAAVGPIGETDAGAPVATRCAQFRRERSAFFGDLHAHTALSLDANLQGTRLRPVEAYRFARGEEVGLPPYDEQGNASRTLSLERPLDFVALSDHAEFLGLVTTCQNEAFEGYHSDQCRSYREAPETAFLTLNAAVAAPQGSAEGAEPCRRGECKSAAMSAWGEVQAAAAAENDTSEACAFTTFVAYEWSASPGLRNLHRNVIFANDKVPALPFSYLDGNQEEELWAALERDCLARPDGCDVLTIPHNSNLSSGLMFEPVNGQGRAIDAAYAEKRAAFEPLVEIIQHKGASECLPEMGNDEQCNFELLPFTTLGGVTLGSPRAEPVPMDFVRKVLGEGLALEERLGVDPFRFGFVGGTDTHLAVPGAVDEGSFPGHGGAGSSARTEKPEGLPDSHWLNPGGLTALWAEENTRDALFRAMKRREAYATSGPRITLRFFGGYGLSADACAAPDFVTQGYAGGVPMGGELDARAGAPRFAVWALRDAGTTASPGAKLAKVQIVKGWVEDGEPKYAVYDVAGPAKPAGGVDEASCAITGGGDDELCATWQDPDHRPGQAAYYYARVLENPTCRWQARICKGRAVDCSAPAKGFEGCCEGEPELHQERAWSSPIFLKRAAP